MTLRKTLFWTHLTVGCFAGAVVFVMSVAGVLLAYQRQITRWVDHDFRLPSPAPGTFRLPIETMVDGIFARNGSLPSAIMLRADPTAPAEVSFGREQVFFVDVYTGKLLGRGSQGTRSFFQSIENWHRWLATSNEYRAVGRALTGACNLGFLLLVLSGPFLWLPRRWSWQSLKAIALFRGGLSGRARELQLAQRDWYLVRAAAVDDRPQRRCHVLSVGQQSALSAHRERSACTDQRPMKIGKTQPLGARAIEQVASIPIGLNALWARAEQQVPGWRSVTLRMPPSGHGQH